MANNVQITAGVGTPVASDELTGGAHAQLIKLLVSAEDDAARIPADAANGLDVDVTRVSGNVTVVQSTAASLKVEAVMAAGSAVVPVNDNSGSLTVDAPATAPVAVRLSDGAAFANAALEHATAASPGSRRLSDGTNFYDSTKTGQLPAALVTGRLDVTLGAAPAAITIQDGGNVISIDDGTGLISVDDGAGSLTVDGTVTANQGTAAAVGNAWPAKVSDGTDTVGISTVGAAKALKVDVVQTVGPGALADKAAFVEGTTTVQAVAGVVNDTIGSDPGEDTAAALRLTSKRGLHVNLRNVSGTEIATAGNPVRTDPTGTTTQPTLDTNSAAIKTSVELLDDAVIATGAAVPAKIHAVGGTDGTNARMLAVNATGHVKVEDGGNSLTIDGTVTANQGTANATPWNMNLSQVGAVAVVVASAGVQKVGVADEAGAAFSETNPLPVRQTYPEQTRFKNAVTYSASQTDIALFTPTGGKRYVLLGIVISSTATGVVKIYDNTNVATNMHFQGTPNGTAPSPPIVITFPVPMPSEAINQVLRYSTGAAAAGDITVWGYEA